ncbi:probable N-acetyltransferase 16 isoform X2 [Hypomesus transpacificus]|nr:probable N-acetyltransferase 16 isoform X2 [Hypomesus transpacificus]XP_046908046.1 probable N-acetyltransferase 16 isoform X2 [Hypomesus transpacificus]XP_046908047.1 probable N-acetyltransferase 16 isoform X2 [Hypomesus transpacificus]XP_046908048.1 probable N-acetyltransferase 16 isoform X2 [Hypomesus transpacificus]XP_046908049.1 probable N-acetyltransferase 16 isoform X2 [Hypomesus transpacificus]XP_046908050.1 probable N-acetyltransferase 16 isoform X2 [Hypomesus transpacificus]XP_04
MEKSCLGNSDDGLTFWLAEEKDYDDVMGISDNIYQGNDYLPRRYHSWMTEPGRVVMLARRGNKLVALESGLLVDDGCTVVVEGLRVCPSERGRGVAGVIQRFLDDYLQKLHPSIQVKRLTRGVEPGEQRLAKFTLLAKRAVLSLVGETVNFHSFTFYLKNKLHSSTGTGSDSGKSVPHLVPLDDKQLRKVLLDPDLPSRVQLPGGAIIQDWQPLQPIEANLEILGRRDLSWLVDDQEKPTFLSFYTPPYPIPYEGGSLRLNIDTFGTDAILARAALVGHFQKVLASGAFSGNGMLMLRVYMDCSLLDGIQSFCEGFEGVRKFRGYWEQELLERQF